MIIYVRLPPPFPQLTIPSHAADQVQHSNQLVATQLELNIMIIEIYLYMKERLRIRKSSIFSLFVKLVRHFILRNHDILIQFNYPHRCLSLHPVHPIFILKGCSWYGQTA